MDNIKIFENPQFGEIRTITQDGKPWFVGKDVAELLGYVKPQNAIAAPWMQKNFYKFECYNYEE